MARISIKSGINKGLEWDLKDGISIVGRDLRNSICLTDLRVSRKHFQIERRGASFVARHLSSTNGTFIGGETIVECLLRDDDEIAVGDTILQFHDPAARSEFSLGGDDTVAWMNEEEDALAANGINYTINMQESSVRRLAAEETDLRQLRALTDRLAMLQDLSNEMTQEFDEEKLMVKLADHIFSVIKSDCGYVFVCEDGSQNLTPVVGREQGEDVELSNIQISRTLVHRAINEKIGILSADTLADDRFKDQGSIILSGIRSALCVPMVFADEVLGLIHLDTKTLMNQFNQEDLKLLTMIANQAAVSLHNARLRDGIVAEQAQRKLLSRYVSPQLVDKLLSEETDGGARARQLELTVLFCDIRGFTRLSERFEPQKVMALLNEYCTRMADIVFEHNGYVDKYIGDCVMAVFGGPEPEEQHAKKALLCALRMQLAVSGMDIQGEHIGVGIGVHTGTCIQGDIGGKNMVQFTAIGDPVNTASRLCGVAGPGDVVASSATLEPCESEFDIQELGEIELKGKVEKIQAYNVIAQKHASTMEAGVIFD